MEGLMEGRPPWVQQQKKSIHIQNNIPKLKTQTLALLNWGSNSVKHAKSTKYMWGKFLFKNAWTTWIQKMKFSSSELDKEKSMTGISIKSKKSNKRDQLVAKEPQHEDDNCALCAICSEHVRSYHEAREISSRNRGRIPTKMLVDAKSPLDTKTTSMQLISLYKKTCNNKPIFCTYP